MPRLLIQFMHKVGTIRRQTFFVVRPSHTLRDRPPLVQRKKPVARRYRWRLRSLRLEARSLLPRLWTWLCSLRTLTSGLLRQLLTWRRRFRLLAGGRLTRSLIWGCGLRLLEGRWLPCLLGLRRARLPCLRLLSRNLFPRLRPWWRRLRLLAGRRLPCLLGLRRTLLTRTLRARAFRRGKRQPQQRRRAHPKREKGPFSHALSLDDCFGWRAVPAAYPLLPLRTAQRRERQVSR
jgi:hypothetical protein